MIRAEEVEFSYNTRVVLRGVSFSIGDGEMVGMIGPNGSGKTTLLRLMSGILRPVSGNINIAINGLSFEPFYIKRRSVAKYVSVLPQNPVVPDDFTVEDVVLMGRYAVSRSISYNRDDYDICLRAMSDVGIAHLKDRLVGQLSGGELKRALIARTLAQETDIVLLDEPTANLDIAGKEKIMALIVKRCRERNMTLVVVMHDIGLAARHMPRLFLISDGKIIADGEPGVVLSEENILGAYGIETEVLWYRGELVIKPQTGNKEEER